MYLLNKFITMGSHLKVLNTEVDSIMFVFQKEQESDMYKQYLT